MRYKVRGDERDRRADYLPVRGQATEVGPLNGAARKPPMAGDRMVPEERTTLMPGLGPVISPDIWCDCCP